MDDSGGFAPPPPPPPSAGGGGNIPQRGLGDILSVAFDVYKANATKLIMIVAIVVVPLSFISAFLSGVVFAPKTTTGTILGQPIEFIEPRSIWIIALSTLATMMIAWVIGAILQAALMRGAALASLGDPVDVEASYKYGFRRWGSVILIALLVGLVVAAGFLLIIIPILGWIAAVVWLVFAGTMLAVAIPALVVENRRGTEAMSRSWELVKGHFWHALGVIVVASIIAGIVAGIIGAIGGSNWFLGWIFGSIGQIITAPFTALVYILLYIDLRARTESLAGERLRSELSSTA